MNDAAKNPDDVYADLRILLYAKNRDFFEKPDVPLDLKAAMAAAVFDCIADGIAVFNAKQTVILANTAAAKIASFDLENTTLIEFQRNFTAYTDDKKRSQIPLEDLPIFVAQRTKEPCELEYFITGKSLPPAGMWIRGKAAPIADDNNDVVGAVSVFHDISQRVKLQRQRDCLTALIAHDIKNHLAANGALLDLLQGLFGENFDQEILTLMGDLKRSNAWFLEVSNSLLEMSRAQFFSAKSYGQDSDLEALLKAVVELNKPAAVEKGITVNLTVAAKIPKVCIIPAVVSQVFHNILQNAFQASDSGTSIEIAVSENHNASTVDVELTDQVRGMAPEVVLALFDSYHTAAHVPGATRSTGFGLYLSAMLVEAQGGKIFCISELGTGTKITVSLPAEECDSPDNSKPS